MPFTLSHAAAVLPAVRADGTGRGRLIPAVLVAGSFAPDMTYYAASAVSGAMEFGDVTHSFPGVFTVDVLVAWALVGLWLLLREPLVALLPRAWQPRPAALLHCGAPRARVRPSLVARWYASAALGALTHVVWDAFTHLDRWGMRLFPALGHKVDGFPLYWYLQYGGSAVAAGVIAVWAGWALRRQPTGAASATGPVSMGRAGDGPTSRQETAGASSAAAGTVGAGRAGDGPASRRETAGLASATGPVSTGRAGDGPTSRQETAGASSAAGPLSAGRAGDGPTGVALLSGRAGAGPTGVAWLSLRDRWWAGAVIGGCAVAGAVQRATRWWAYWGSTAKPWELIPAVCFGAGAGLVLGLLLYAVGVRVWRRPAPDAADPEPVSAA
ncbi:DUF4184 family protein [Streptomyces sp. NBC_00078]|uniref:DUF4184 family protein n=1 Tax=unclassified Streptomyces TaxID=2593676 RepID=UPI00224DEED8|nr:DUF4184 family protein [Streptomyces sp. NBC_00078]MCX5420065.1 DUF4184 family protein [Streptomyces sp. NBC_00078]